MPYQTQQSPLFFFDNNPVNMPISKINYNIHMDTTNHLINPPPTKRRPSEPLLHEAPDVLGWRLFVNSLTRDSEFWLLFQKTPRLENPNSST